MAIDREDNDTLISRTDTSAATMARETYENTGRTTSPYLARPERESFSIIEKYRRPDGSMFLRTCEVSRWGGESSFGPWTIKEVSQ